MPSPEPADADDVLAFEHLVADLTARFIDIAPEQVDEAIVDCQRQMVEALGLDRSSLWQAEDGDLRSTHLWSRPECAVPLETVAASGAFPWFVAQVREGRTVVVDDVAHIPSPVDRSTLARYGTTSNVVVPLFVGGQWLGALSFASVRGPREWPEALIDRLKLIGHVFAQALARSRSAQALEAALADVRALRDQLARDNAVLQSEVRILRASSHIASESAAVKRVLQRIDQVAPTNATVLLLGETGSGKEVFAQEIHDRSPRHRRPMVRVNCGAIPTTLIESELFGRERGAFTGAVARQVGRFELAEGSTVFLDEIGELPLEAQVKLLRVVQDHVVERLGSAQPLKVDVRVIAATNRNLEEAVASRAFREDLFYRLNVFPITIPPLRERVEDIPVLAWSFVDEFAKSFGKTITSIARESMEWLQRYSWPGNVRELRNVLEYAVIVANGPRLEIEPPAARASAQQKSLRLSDVEASHIRAVLENTGWRIRGANGAAQVLGVKPTTLEGRMAKLGIRRPERQV